MLFILRQMRLFTSHVVLNRVRSERGATAVEYGLLVALIAVAIVGAVTLLGGSISSMFTDAGNSIKKAPATTTP